MCWSNYMATPIVLKKPLRVYKVGTVSIFCSFISLYQDFIYRKSQTMPTVKINPVFIRYYSTIRLLSWQNDYFHIYEGYHSYLTKEMAKCSRDERDDIGIFEIPAGATIYINYKRREIVMATYRIVDMHRKSKSIKGTHYDSWNNQILNYRVDKRHSLLFGLIHYWDHGAYNLCPEYLFSSADKAKEAIFKVDKSKIITILYK